MSSGAEDRTTQDASAKLRGGNLGAEGGATRQDGSGRAGVNLLISRN